MTRLIDFQYSWHRLVILSAMLSMLQGCNLSLPLPELGRSQTELSAAAFYHWAGIASDREKQQRLASLQSRLDNKDDTVALVQRAILIYHLEDNGAALSDLNLSPPFDPGCTADIRCQDYASFLALIQELQSLQLQVSRQRDDVRALQDRIRVLNQQIEALTNIEQQLLEREQRRD